MIIAHSRVLPLGGTLASTHPTSCAGQAQGSLRAGPLGILLAVIFSYSPKARLANIHVSNSSHMRNQMEHCKVRAWITHSINKIMLYMEVGMGLKLQ